MAPPDVTAARPNGAAARGADGAAPGDGEKREDPRELVQRLPPPRLFSTEEQPQRIESIFFGLLSDVEIARVSEIEVVNRELYPAMNPVPMPYGCLDRRLGVSEKGSMRDPTLCATCHKRLADCVGHFGFVKLALPVFHIGYFKAILLTLQCICKTCGRLLLPVPEREPFLRKLRASESDSLLKKSILKAITDRCKRATSCQHCSAPNGKTKKVGQLLIKHEPFPARARNDNHAKMDFHATFETAVSQNKDLKQFVNRAQDDITPLRALELFKRMTSEDCELLDMNPIAGRPERLIVSRLIVPPVCIRPSVRMDAAGTNEDDLTMKLSEIININNHLRFKLEQGVRVTDIMDLWDCLQLQCAIYINSEIPGVPSLVQKTGKPIRGFCQRLKGKHGRFRGNLSGKRVDFSGRTVISPDPNLLIHQVGLPIKACKMLTYPERVTRYNIEKLRRLVENGSNVHPGANHIVEKATGFKIDLRLGDRKRFARRLQIGDVVERHVDDGDYVLFNRQPSLHKMSIMCHEVKAMPWRTFRFNECVCAPYNADFDGDEMNIHVPQTEEARAEALSLMAVPRNIITPRSGEPLISATQDFLTGAYLLTRRDVFFDRAEVCQLISYAFDGVVRIDLPPPTIFKPVRLWTGKQVFSLILTPNRKNSFKVNLEVKEKNIYRSDNHMCPKDGFVCFRNGELISGTLGKTALGGGSKNNLFYTLVKQYDFRAAAVCMSRVAKLTSRFMANRGFSIGITDVSPSADLVVKKERLIEDGYSVCDDFIDKYKNGKLQRQAGFNAEQTLEAVITGTLSKIRDDAGALCIRELPWVNAPLIMAVCGSKGSTINLCQMIACVGQQTVSGSRIPNGFSARTLPHFSHNSKLPAAKGFVRNSFFSGITPTEFFFHTMGGREGLVDTAVKTAETGYMQRRLMKALEDLSCQYDQTVRNSTGGIVQFRYGDDGLDPTHMEAPDGRPVNLEKLLMHVRSVFPCYNEPTLKPYQLRALFEPALAQLAPRVSDMFVKELTDFMHVVIERHAAVRARFGLQRLDTPPDSGAAASAPVSGSTVTGKRRASARDAVARVLEDPHASRIADLVCRFTATQLDEFMKQVWLKYQRALVEPGEAVGAVGAQSIGEPGTQMTLKTFHFAGVASMNVTLGVPRIKEIINASKTISTPITTAGLDQEKSETFARVVKARIEKTTLGEIAVYIREVIEANSAHLVVRFDLEAIEALQLQITVHTIRTAITTQLKKIRANHVNVLSRSDLRVDVADQLAAEALFFALRALKAQLRAVVVKGVPQVERAVISHVEEEGPAANKGGEPRFNLLVEGYGLRQVMNTPGVRGTHTTSNHIIEVANVLGIEAARATISHEILYTMGKHGMSIDSRHVALLADLMTYRGEVLGITRFGISRMKDSVLLLASFEKTTDHLFDAAVHAKRDPVDGVSECIIMGVPIPLGTGLFRLLHDSAAACPNQRLALRAQRTPLLAPSKCTLDVRTLDPTARPSASSASSASSAAAAAAAHS